MYPGLPSRLEKDIKSLYLKNVLKGKTVVLFITILRFCFDSHHCIIYYYFTFLF
jgi:hypothetical protein